MTNLLVYVFVLAALAGSTYEAVERIADLLGM